MRALNRAEQAMDADLSKYLPLWKLAVPAEFENYYPWDFSKFGRGERFANKPLPRGEFDEVFAQVERWGLDQYLKDRSPLRPRRFCKCAKHRKDQRLALEIVGIHVTRSAIDLLPGVRDARHPRPFLSGVTEPRGQPTVDQIHEGFKHLRVSPAHSITEGVQSASVDFWQICQQIKNALAQGQGLTF